VPKPATDVQKQHMVEIRSESRERCGK